MADSRVKDLALLTSIDTTNDSFLVEDASTNETKRTTLDYVRTALGVSGTNTGDQNMFTQIDVAGQTKVEPDSPNDVLTLVAGSNITITTDASTDSITISATGGGSSTWGSITGTLSSQTDLQSALDGKVDENTPITGATKTKITYDSKGLVTSGADAGIADITGLQTALDGKVDENPGITGATKTKITYDSKGLVTSGADAGIADITGLQTALDGKVDENAAITGATKTKITYDAKGLVTAGADATTADIADSTNKRYVTDADLTKLSNTSGTNTGDQNLFSTIAVAGQSNVVADTTGDTLTLVAGSNVTITTDATTDTITIAASSGGVSDGDKGDITVSGSGSTWTVDNDAITYGKIQNVSATSRILGRKTAGAGDIEELTASDTLDFVGSTQGQILYRGASGWAVLSPGTSGQVLQTNGAGANPSWATAGGGSIGGSTGSTDNAMLRADGTGGATIQSSDISIDDATISTQANVTVANIHSGQTNSSLVLSPKGTGAFILGPKPDGATAGGNARGSYSVDMQILRSTNTQVASGSYSFNVGRNNTVSGPFSGAIGDGNIVSNTGNGYGFAAGISNTVSGQRAAALGSLNTVSLRAGFAAGESNTVSADSGVALGSQNTVNTGSTNGVALGNSCQTTGTFSFASGQGSRTDGNFSQAGGQYAYTRLRGQQSFASGRFTADGDCQRSTIGAFKSITGTAATNLHLDGTSLTLDIPGTNTVWGFRVQIVGVCTTTGGSINANDVFMGMYNGCIKRVGGTASLVGTIDTVTTKSDGGFVANVPTIAITASGTTLDVKWTTTGGAAGTVVRVNARIDLVEISW